MPLVTRMLEASAGVSGSTITDSFNRADSSTTLGTADTGQTWVVLVGTWGITSNRAACIASVASEALAYIDSGRADCTVTVTTPSPSAAVDLMFRASSSTNYWLLDNTGSTYALFKRVSGSYTQVTSWTGAPVAGDVLSVVLSGSTITAKINGVTKATITDSFNSTATWHGLRAANNLGRHDDFSVV